MGTQTLGTVIIRVDGQRLRSEPGASIDIGGYDRDAVVGDSPTDIGFAQKTKPSEVDCTVMQDANTSLDAMRGWGDVTLQFECDTGQTYLVAHAFLSTTPKTTGGAGGKVALKFMGPPAQEI
jgi:hypothetical protein